MTTAGTYYYPPSAGTGNLLLANPPFVFDSMDTNQPTTADGLPELTEFHALREKAPRYRDGGVGRELWIAQKAYRMGADAELEACCKWMDSFDPCWDYVDDLRAARRPKSPPPPFVASEEDVPAPQPGEWRSMPAPSEDDAGSDGKVWAWVSGQPATRLHWHNARHLMLCKRLSFWAPGNRPAPTSPPLVSMTDGHGAKAEPAPKSPPPSVVGSQEVEPEKPRGFFPFAPEDFAAACSEAQPEAPLNPAQSRTGGWIVDRLPMQADADRGGHVLVPSRNGSRGMSFVHFLSVFPGTPWAPVSAETDPWDPTCLDRNGWIRSRLPTVEDTGNTGHVLIPVGHGGTNASINYHLIVPGQPWAPWGSSPGGFSK